MEDPYSNSPHSNVERDNLEEFSYFLALEEVVDLDERPLDEPLSNRRYAWYSNILQDAKKMEHQQEHRESNRGLKGIHGMLHISDSEPSSHCLQAVLG